MTRVVVTGVGAVSPLGIGIDALWTGLTEGRSGIAPIQNFDASDLDVKIAGEVNDFVPRDFMDFKAAKRMDRFAQFAVAATREALDMADFAITEDNSERVGVMMNTGGGGFPTIEREVLVKTNGGPKRVSPFLIPMFAPNMASCQVSMQFGIHGPTDVAVGPWMPNCMLT